jgi:hypothetical protein
MVIAGIMHDKKSVPLLNVRERHLMAKTYLLVIQDDRHPLLSLMDKLYGNRPITVKSLESITKGQGAAGPVLDLNSR